MREFLKKIKKKLVIPIIEKEENDSRTEEEKNISSMRCAIIIITSDLIAFGIIATVILFYILK